MPKIWSYTDPSLSGFGLFKRCIFSELSQFHWDTNLSVLPLLDPQSKPKLCQHLFDTNPDWILLINQSAQQFYDYIALPLEYRPLPIKKLVWYLDDPKFFIETPFEKEEFVLSFDETYLDFILSYNPGGAAFFPLAADILNPGTHNQQYQCDVCFVGGVIDQSDKRQQLNQSMQRYVDQLVELKLTCRWKSFSEIALENPIQPGKKIQITGKVANYLYWEANNRYRINILRALQDYNLKIYGNEDWLKLLQGDSLLSCYMRSCDSVTELPDIFASVPINLNIHSVQCQGSMNQRDFNAPMAKGFLLSDWVPCAGKYFSPGQEAIYWSSIDDLRKKIDYYLEHANERLHIINNARDRVSKYHTYQKRVELLLDMLTNKGWY